MKTTTSYAIFLLACLTILYPQSAVSQGNLLAVAVWNEGTGNTYIVVELNGAGWHEATADAATLFPGYRLATITSQAEQDFVNNMLISAGLGSQYWIGGFQESPKPEIDPSAGWHWVTGELWDFTYWGAIEPNDAGGIEDFLTTSAHMGWNDEGTAVGSVQGYIAESQGFTPSVVMASSTWPSGTNYGGFESATDNPLGPFSNAGVHFRGTDFGGEPEVYRFRLDFDETVVLHSISVEGAAWAAESADQIEKLRIYDENDMLISEVDALFGSNSFQVVEVPAYGFVGRTFFLEEINSDGLWRYRSNVAAHFEIEQSYENIGDATAGIIEDVELAAGSAGVAGVVQPGGLLPGAEAFVDRVGQLWLGIPSQLLGADYIQTAQDNADAGPIAINVTVARATILHMLVPEHDGLLPTVWMNDAIFGSDWVNTGAVVYTSWSSPAQVWSTAEPLQAGTYTFKELPTNLSFYGIAATEGTLPAPQVTPRPQTRKSGGGFGVGEILALCLAMSLRLRIRRFGSTR